MADFSNCYNAYSTQQEFSTRENIDKNAHVQVVSNEDRTTGRSIQRERLSDIELRLDNIDSEADRPCGVRIYIGGDDMFTIASSEAETSRSRVMSINEDVVSPKYEGSESIAYVSNRGLNKVTKFLVQPDENKGLKISGVVVVNGNDGRMTRIPVDDVILSNGSSVGQIILEKPNYSLLRHVGDVFSGYAQPEFYENMTKHGYGLTMRSLVRHALNNVETLVKGHGTQISVDDLDKQIRKEKKVEGLSPSFISNMYLHDSKGSCGSLTKPVSRESMADSTRATDCRAADDQICQQVRRELGVEDSLSTMESTIMIGTATAGMMLSALMSRRTVAIKMQKSSYVARRNYSLMGILRNL